MQLHVNMWSTQIYDLQKLGGDDASFPWNKLNCYGVDAKLLTYQVILHDEGRIIIVTASVFCLIIHRF